MRVRVVMRGAVAAASVLALVLSAVTVAATGAAAAEPVRPYESVRPPAHCFTAPVARAGFWGVPDSPAYDRRHADELAETGDRSCYPPAGYAPFLCPAQDGVLLRTLCFHAIDRIGSDTYYGWRAWLRIGGTGAPPGSPGDPAPSPEDPEGLTNPVYFVAGLDPDLISPGYDCSAVWSPTTNRLIEWGLTGERVLASFYSDDVNCNLSLRQFRHPDGRDHVAGGERGSGYGPNASIRQLGYHLAWAIHQRNTANGQPVNIVGHSMGGLIARYAIAQVQAGHPDFPPSLMVDTVVTLGTPHAGSNSALLCALPMTQCDEMRPLSEFMRGLSASAANPQGTGGTRWVAVISADDGVVSSLSGVGMGGADKVDYDGGLNMTHNEYMKFTQQLANARGVVQYGNGAAAQRSDLPHPVRLIFEAFQGARW